MPYLILHFFYFGGLTFLYNKISENQSIVFLYDPFPEPTLKLVFFGIIGIFWAAGLHEVYQFVFVNGFTFTIQFDQASRLLYYMYLITPLIYFGVNYFFDTLRQFQQASLDVEKYHLDNIQAHLSTLKSQISPHFLFNSLNALSSLIQTDETKAIRFVEELAAVFRYLLEKNEKELVPLYSELDFLRAYLFLLQIRFRENLRISVDIPATLLEAQLPPLTLQLLLENAIKHNIVSKEEPLWVTITASEEGLTVRNNLQLRVKNRTSTGVGLTNIIQRYKYLTDRMVDIRQTASEFIACVPLILETERPNL